MTDEPIALEDVPTPEAPSPRWKFRANCTTCGNPIEQGRETPSGLIPVGHLVTRPDGKTGLQCDPCFARHEAHKAE